MTVALDQRRWRVRLNWYNPFAKLTTPQDAKRAAEMGGGVVLALQGLGLLVTFMRLLPPLQHPAASKAFYAACGGMAAAALLGALLVAIGLDLARRQAVWAAVALAILVGIGTMVQLAHNWVHLIGYASIASVGGSILCIRGALASQRRWPDLDVFT